MAVHWSGTKKGRSPFLVLCGLLVAVIFLPVRVGLAEEKEWQEPEFDDFADLPLDKLLDVVVTASKHAQDVAESPSAISVITRKQIENTYCTDVACLLRQLPEVDVIRVKPMHVGVGARALVDDAGDKVLVLIDGQEINIEVFGMVFWQTMMVHLDDIERIEVIRGPGSALYGANAHSMVVSIFTRKAAENTAEVFLGAGEYDLSSAHLRVGQQFGDWRLLLSGGLETAGNWQIPWQRERQMHRLRLGLEHETKSGTTSVALGVASFEGAIYSVIGPADLRDLLYGELSAIHKTDLWQLKLWFNIIDGAIPIEPNVVELGSIKLGELTDLVPFTNPTLDVEAQVNLQLWNGNLLISGANYRWIGFWCEECLPEETFQHRVGAFLHDEQRFGESLILSGGVRLDYNSLTVNPLIVSPRLAAVWGFHDNQYLRLAFGQAFRKPSFFNTTINLKNIKAESAFPEFEDFMHRTIGNEDVESESITAFEAGYLGRFLERAITTEAVVFYNRYRNTITFHLQMAFNNFGLPDLRNSVAQYRNTGREVDSLGGSVSFTYRMSEALRLNANYTFRYSFYASDPGGLAVVGEGGKGDRVTWEPAHLANLTFHYVPKRGLRCGLGWHAASARTGAISPGGAFDARVQVHQEAGWFASFFIAWRFTSGPAWLELGVRAFNVFEMPFRDLAGREKMEGVPVGGEVIGRRVFLFLRGAI